MRAFICAGAFFDKDFRCGLSDRHIIAVVVAGFEGEAVSKMLTKYPNSVLKDWMVSKVDTSIAGIYTISDYAW